MEKTAIQILPELVRKQLQQILQQEEIRRSPVLAKFLEFVVISRLEGKEDEIKEYTIGVKALGKPMSFNPQLDAVVRIHASRLRNFLFKYYHGVGKNDLIFINIPKGTYIPVFERNNAKTEVLRHFVNSEAEINSHERPSPQARPGHPKPVLAVLPFHDLSPESSNNNFLASLVEQLTTELARFDSISIISYYATQNFDRKKNGLRDLQKENEIDYVLTGSLRLLNGTLRLNIQLMMVDTGNILWSDSFQRNDLSDENTMDIQDEMISQIANVVADDHGMVGKLNKLKPWKNSEEYNEVHDAIIQYFDYTYNYDSKKFEATLNAMEKAYHLTNDNPLITAILAKLYLDQFAASIERDQRLLEKGLELAHMAVRLDPRSQHAYKSLAWGLVLSGQKEKSSEAIDRCIALNPTAASNLGTIGLSLIMQGEYESGFLMLTQALQFTQDPSTCVKLGLALFYYHAGSYEESKKWLDRLPPFELPFTTLLGIAIQGNITG
ncbi:MAG: tetratricopeptide repeat protein, partial [Flavisolibacter sp.]